MITLDNLDEYMESQSKSEDLVFELSALVDDPNNAVPMYFIDKAQILEGQRLHAHYVSLYGYLITLWARARVLAGPKEPIKIAVRDVIEKFASTCKLKYEAASRGLSGFQALQEEDRDYRRV